MRRPMTIAAALEWAFATERAQLDFAESLGDNVRPGVSTLWTIQQRGHLGCSVDGGGHSLPHHEADMIASAVAHLPREQGGRAIAILIAECARAGTVPEWRTEAPRWTARAWKAENQHGRDAETEVVGLETFYRRGRRVQVQVLACPVRLTVSADRIAAGRARYAVWRAALSWLALSLRPRLDHVQILPGLPVAAPWESAQPRAKVA
jgi:hypothetical protein